MGSAPPRRFWRKKQDIQDHAAAKKRAYAALKAKYAARQPATNEHD